MYSYTTMVNRPRGGLVPLLVGYVIQFVRQLTHVGGQFEAPRPDLHNNDIRRLAGTFSHDAHGFFIGANSINTFE